MLHRLLIILKAVGLFCLVMITWTLALVELVFAPLEYLFFGPEKAMFWWKIFAWSATELINIEF